VASYAVTIAIFVPSFFLARSSGTVIFGDDMTRSS
jgi:hypothetical protein